MIRTHFSSWLILISALLFSQVSAEENKLTTIDLKHITGEDVISVLKSLVDKSVSISEKNNVLLINGPQSKTKNIIHIVNKIDTAAAPLTIEFIASNKKINFKSSGTTYQSGKSRNNTSQSMSITERQWVTLNTGLSIPIAQRKRLPDGTETQSFSYKKISKQYVFKVHEFSGWSVVQVGLNTSSVSEDVAGAIEHTELDTTVIGKTGEWLEVASSNPINENTSTQSYSTNRTNKNFIHLYVRVKHSEIKVPVITESEIQPDKTQ